MLLLKRQKSILLNLRQSKKQAAEIEQRFLDAQTKFKKASEEAFEIRQRTQESIKKQHKEYENKLSRDLQKLEELKNSTINFQRQKTKAQIANQLIDSTIQKVEEKFQTEFCDENIQDRINLRLVEEFKKL